MPDIFDRELAALLDSYKVEEPSPELMERILRRAQPRAGAAVIPLWAQRQTFRPHSAFALIGLALLGFWLGSASQVKPFSVTSAPSVSTLTLDGVILGASNLNEVIL